MDVLKLSDFTVAQINQILDLAFAFKNGKKVDYKRQKSVAFLFFENSTRTHYSFEMAALKLGCVTQNFEAATSSVQKGETLYDTVKLFECLGHDAIVIRHKQNNYFDELKGIQTPILNGGDGTGNHPSQSLLDLMTIREHFGHFEGLKVAICGDIKHSRVAHSNYEVMKRLGMDVVMCGPEEFREDGYPFYSLDEVISNVDVVMMLRVQHERHEGNMQLSKEAYHEAYGLNARRVALMKDDAIIMHPAPFNRGVEISDDVVECEKSRIFDQMANGVYVRMALLYKAIEGGKWDDDLENCK